MEETKQKIMAFLEEIYTKTGGFPYVNGAAISNLIGRYPKIELNELYHEGKIKPHDSIHGILIEYVKP